MGVHIPLVFEKPQKNFCDLLRENGFFIFKNKLKRGCFSTFSGIGVDDSIMTTLDPRGIRRKKKLYSGCENSVQKAPLISLIFLLKCDFLRFMWEFFLWLKY